MSCLRRKTAYAYGSDVGFWPAELYGRSSKPTDWDKIVEAAKKEGKVVASIPPSPEAAQG